MKIIEFVRDRTLICQFRQHNFELERDPNEQYGNWYMQVTDSSGSFACDGWIDDSSSLTAQQAMGAACDGALLEPPKRWPKSAI